MKYKLGDYVLINKGGEVISGKLVYQYKDRGFAAVLSDYKYKLFGWVDLELCKRLGLPEDSRFTYAYNRKNLDTYSSIIGYDKNQTILKRCKS